MAKNLKIWLGIVILVAFGGTLAFAQELVSVNTAGTASVLGTATGIGTTATTDVAATTGAESPSQALPQDAASEQAAFMKKLQQELDISKAEYYQITSTVREARTRITSLKDQMSELQNQLTYFDDQIATTENKLFTVVRQVVRKENEIKILYDEIDMKETALAYQKELLKDYIRQLYVYGDTYLDVDEKGNIDAFKILLADGSTGDVLKEIKYLGILEETGDMLVEKLSQITTDLETAKTDIEGKRLSLGKLENELRLQKEYLASQKAAKENLLAISKNQDEVYRDLLKTSMDEQDESIAEIQALKESITFIEKKIVEDGENFDISKYENIVGKKFMTLYAFQRNSSASRDESEMIWPILPERGISAYFHDPSYRGYFGVQHNAIDIRAGQGTAIRAPLDGVVYKTKDNGYGYSYIIVVHRGNLMTTYGHVSNIMVEEGQVVEAGDILGLSGGMPGTKGAGYMTTGPHLHFEVSQNSIYVDPLRFLPIELMSEENIKELPTIYLEQWESAVLGE